MNFYGCIVGFILISASSCISITSAELRPTVRIQQGLLKGKIMTSRNGKEFAAYLGIPYAEPPVKNLRLMPPVPATGWSGERDAIEDSSECFQQATNAGNKTVKVGSEDCLYLNVYTPRDVRSPKKKIYPVMVFIHGGSLTSGDSKSSSFGPEYLMDKDIVLVIFNYRLGLLGFMSMEDDVLPGNYGLKDQVLALKWVKRNIENFAGNPDEITLFGQSAGAVSVSMHLLSPQSKGLFNRVITESGSPLNFWSMSHPGKKKNEASLFAWINGCDKLTNEKLLECFQQLPVDAFILSKASGVVNIILNSLPYNIGIVRESKRIKDPFLIENPWTEIVKPSNVTWMMGINSGEGTWTADQIYPNYKSLLDFADSFSGLNFPLLFGYSYVETEEFGRKATVKVKEFYFGNKSLVDSYRQFAELCTDRAFLQPAIDAAKNYKGPKYFYYYDFVSEFRKKLNEQAAREIIGPSHGDDLVNLFYIPNLTGKTVSSKEKEISEAMVEYWTNFAIHGTPNPENCKLPKWKPIQSADDIEYLYIGKDHPEMRSGLRKDRYDLWNGLGFKHDF